MVLLSSPNMDLVLLIFIVVILLKNSFFKDKSSGLRWLVAGGFFILVPIALYAVNWNRLGFSQTMWQIDTFLSLAGALVILVGLFKLFQELFER